MPGIQGIRGSCKGRRQRRQACPPSCQAAGVGEGGRTGKDGGSEKGAADIDALHPRPAATRRGGEGGKGGGGHDALTQGGGGGCMYVGRGVQKKFGGCGSFKGLVTRFRPPTKVSVLLPPPYLSTRLGYYYYDSHSPLSPSSTPCVCERERGSK